MAIASASRPLLGVRAAIGRLSSGRFRPRISQASPGEWIGGVRDAATAAAALRLEEEDFPELDERRSPEESEGREEDRDLSL